MIDTSETFSGTTMIIPQTARTRLSRDQAEIVYCGGHTWCDDADCMRSHTGSRLRGEGGEFLEFYPIKLRQHTTHKHLIRGSWVLTAPRARLMIPGYPDLSLIGMDDLWAILT